MKQDKIKLIMTIACICFAVLAVVFLVSGIIYSGDHEFTKVILFVIAVISVIAAGELAYLVWFGKGGETPNFFLFNEVKKVNIPVEALSDKRINSVEEVVNIGDKVKVEIVKIGEKGIDLKLLK